MTDQTGVASATYEEAVRSETRGKPRLASVLGQFLLDLVVVVSIYVAVIVLTMFVGYAVTGSDAWLSETGTEAAMGVFLLATTLVATVLIYLSRARASRVEIARANAGLQRAQTWWWSVLVLVGLWLLSFGVDWLAGIQDMDLLPSNEVDIEGWLAASPVFAWLFVVVVAPVCEEILFRRVLFGRFMRAGRPVLGYVLTGALFASMHEGPWLSTGNWAETTLLWLNYFAFGAGLAWLYRRTDTLWAPILVHAANNAIWLGWMAAG